MACLQHCRRRMFATVAVDNLQKAIIDAARTKQTGVSLQTLLQFGKQAHDVALPDTLLASARFLKRELPIRFAHRIVELDNLPHGLNKQPSIRRVSEWYKLSFDDIVKAPLPHDAPSEEAFTRLLQSIYERHNPTLVSTAKGIYEFKNYLGLPSGPLPLLIEEDIHSYLDVFFTSRVGIRTLMSQHIAMHGTGRQHYVGIIHTQCRPAHIIADAVDDAKTVCERVYGDVPEVEILGDTDFVFSYVPSYLHHIIFELAKNSMRAVVEAHGKEAKLPPVKIIISASADSEDVVIKISDEGGGIPRSGMRRIFSYFYTTAPPQFSADDAADFSKEIPMAGLGVGLPLSRVYARYFGGDLQIISMEGYGTDAYVFLRRLGDAAEPLSECANGAQLGEFARALASGSAPGAMQSSMKGALDAIHLQAFPHTAQQPHASFRISMKKATVPPPPGGSGSTSSSTNGVTTNSSADDGKRSTTSGFIAAPSSQTPQHVRQQHGTFASNTVISTPSAGSVVTGGKLVGGSDSQWNASYVGGGVLTSFKLAPRKPENY